MNERECQGRQGQGRRSRSHLGQMCLKEAGDEELGWDASVCLLAWRTQSVRADGCLMVPLVP